MNLNEQLQQAYEAGRRQGLNEQLDEGAGAPLFRKIVKGLRRPVGRVVRNNIPAGVIPSRFNWGSNQGWQEFLNAMEWITRGNMHTSKRYLFLVEFLTNPTSENLQALNRVLRQWGIVLAQSNGTLQLHGADQFSNINFPWMDAIRNLFLEYNLPWPPPGP